MVASFSPARRLSISFLITQRNSQFTPRRYYIANLSSVAGRLSVNELPEQVQALSVMERVGVRELDLSNCGPGSVAERVGVVPGLRSSAGEFYAMPVQVLSI